MNRRILFDIIKESGGLSDSHLRLVRGFVHGIAKNSQTKELNDETVDLILLFVDSYISKLQEV